MGNKYSSILDKYNTTDIFKIKPTKKCIINNITYTNDNKLYLLLFSDFLIILNNLEQEILYISYYNILSWGFYNNKPILFFKVKETLSSEKNNYYFNCYKNKSDNIKIINILKQYTTELKNYVDNLYEENN